MITNPLVGPNHNYCRNERTEVCERVPTVLEQISTKIRPDRFQEAPRMEYGLLGIVNYHV